MWTGRRDKFVLVYHILFTLMPSVNPILSSVKRRLYRLDTMELRHVALSYITMFLCIHISVWHFTVLSSAITLFHELSRL